MNKIIETMTSSLFGKVDYEDETFAWIVSTLKAALNLRYDNGKKMLAILAEKQSFEMDYDKAPFAFLSAVDAGKLIEKQMFNTDADGFAFRRVFAGKTEDNNG